jgi:NADH-quinone oxidoreductase subunit K
MTTLMSLPAFLLLGGLLFGIGLVGILINRHNLIVLLMCIELLLLGVNTNFIAFSHYLNALDGQVFVFFILTVAAAEAAIGLALLVVLYQHRGTIDIHKMDTLKG